MLLLPAIDLMAGEVVRLKRGLAEQKTVYSSDPVSIARKWEEAGADWLHLVDLDAAFSGEPRNLPSIERICAAVSIPCELGGGMRNVRNISRAFAAGVDRVILGTSAWESMEFVRQACAEFGGDRIAVGIDARNGLIAVRGWTELTTRSAAISPLRLRRRAQALLSTPTSPPTACSKALTTLRCRTCSELSMATSLPAAEWPVSKTSSGWRRCPGCMERSLEKPFMRE